MTYTDHFFPDLFADGTYVLSNGIYGTDFSVSHSIIGGVVHGDFSAVGTDWLAAGNKITWYDPRVALPNPFKIGQTFIGPIDYSADFDPTFLEFGGFTDTGGDGFPGPGGPNGVVGGLQGAAGSMQLRLVGYDAADAGDGFDWTLAIPDPAGIAAGDGSDPSTVVFSITPGGLMVAQCGLQAIAFRVSDALMTALAARTLHPTGVSGTVDFFESWGYDVEGAGPPLIPGTVKASLEVTSGARRANRRPTGG